MAARCAHNAEVARSIRAPRILLFIAALFITSCATPKRTYQPPDATEVNRLTGEVKSGITKSREAFKGGRTDIESSQKEVDALSLASVDLLKQIDELGKVAPAVLQPRIGSIKLGFDKFQSHEDALTSHLAAGWTKINDGEQVIIITQAKEIELEKKQAGYYAEAKTLADNATAENRARVSAEEKLHWYRMHWWGTWIACGAGIILFLVLAFLKFTGRLALKSAIP